MMLLSVLFLTAAALSFALAVRNYFQCEQKCDVMGASFGFTGMWFTGAGLLGWGFGLIWRSFGLGIGLAFGVAVLGKTIEWFVLPMFVRVKQEGRET